MQLKRRMSLALILGSLLAVGMGWSDGADRLPGEAAANTDDASRIPPHPDRTPDGHQVIVSSAPTGGAAVGEMPSEPPPPRDQTPAKDNATITLPAWARAGVEAVADPAPRK